MDTSRGSAGILAWHFLRPDGRLGHPPHTAVVVGEPIEVAFPWTDPDDGVTFARPVLGRAGLHAGRRPIDALKYAPGPIACRVRCEGDIVEGDSGLACTRRTVLAMGDASAALQEFVCRCAGAHLWRERGAGREPGPRSWGAIGATRARVMGGATDRDLAAVRGVAWAAAGDAACAAGAAWAAAGDAGDDARVAARAAARDAALAGQDRILEGLLAELLGLTGTDRDV